MLDYICDNCGKVYESNMDFKEIGSNDWPSMEPGTTVPDGICECGGFIYYKRPPRNHSMTDWVNRKKLDAIISVLGEDRMTAVNGDVVLAVLALVESENKKASK